MTTGIKVDDAALRRVDELCDAMDREWVMAHYPNEKGGRWLDDYRAYWLQLAREGSPLPVNWHNGEREDQLEERLATYGSREWRQAYPRLARKLREKGVIEK